MSYSDVTAALESGLSPAAICSTCPWDRFCIEPPSVSSAEVRRQIDEASAKDQRAADEAKAKGEKPGMPVGTLLMTLAVAGRDKQASICPVLAMSMRTDHGENVVRAVKRVMQDYATTEQS